MKHLSFDFFTNINDKQYGISLILWPPRYLFFGTDKMQQATTGRRMVSYSFGPIVIRVCEVEPVRPEDFIE